MTILPICHQTTHTDQAELAVPRFHPLLPQPDNLAVHRPDWVMGP